MSTSDSFLGKEIDAIDDVRLRLERFPSAISDLPDLLSDDYWRVIDLSTQSRTLSPGELGSLNYSLAELNDNYLTLESMLGSATLMAAYNSVASQCNDINSADVNRVGVGQLYAPLSEQAQLSAVN